MFSRLMRTEIHLKIKFRYMLASEVSHYSYISLLAIKLYFLPVSGISKQDEI